MKNSILLLSALVSIGPLGVAQDETEDEWTALDRELRDLEILQAEDPPGPQIWGYLRTNFTYSNHQITDAGPPGDYTGFTLDNLRLNVTGEVEGYSYRITSEARSGELSIEDAWVRSSLSDEIGVWVGLFRTPFLRSGLIEARDLLFITRTRNGVFYSERDMGAMATGDHGRLHWALALHNGADGMIDRFLQTLHAHVNIVGEEALPWEGAYHAGPNTRFTLGAGVSNDDARAGSGQGTAFAAEAYLVHKGFYLTAEWLDYEGAYDLFPFETVPGDQMEQRGDTSPWSITASYMIVPEKYELAIRYDNLDDRTSPLDYDRETWTFGVNRYVLGHDLKWQLNYADAVKNGTDDGPHESFIALGLTLSF